MSDYNNYNNSYNNSNYGNNTGNEYHYNNNYDSNYNNNYGSNYNNNMNSGIGDTPNYYFQSLVDTDSVVRKAFGFMFIALIITAIGAIVTPPDVAISMMSGGSFFILLVAELGLVFVSNYAIKNNNVVLAAILYIAYSFITGMTFSILALAYTGSSIVSVFFITSAIFAIMCIYGYTTKADLTSIGNLCIMALLGLIIASVVNIVFLHSSGISLALSYVGVLIFVGLTAYDVQKIKNMSNTVGEDNETALALYGAFELYLDFINLFLKLLRIMGKRRN